MGSLYRPKYRDRSSHEWLSDEETHDERIAGRITDIQKSVGTHGLTPSRPSIGVAVVTFAAGPGPTRPTINAVGV